MSQSSIAACIHDHIERMPMGYRSLVGDMGSTLSGGQQQRVMIARALYRNPQILVLDEGTSHLDVDTEKAVNAALSALAITRIVVAHRPETIRSAARVLTLMAASTTINILILVLYSRKQ
jgi:ATP-binding cassette subfamily B protein RaxB